MLQFLCVCIWSSAVVAVVVVAAAAVVVAVVAEYALVFAAYNDLVVIVNGFKVVAIVIAIDVLDIGAADVGRPVAFYV